MLLDTPLFLQIGRKVSAYTNAANASEEYRKIIDLLDVGASEAPLCKIIDKSKKVVGHVSYNGKVWAGAKWTDGDTPIYNPYAIGAA